MKKLLFVVTAFFFAQFFASNPLFSQPRFSSQGHKGKVVAAFADAAAKDFAFYTVGEDGFLIRWQNGIGERFQVSDKKISLACASPNGKEIAFYERDDAAYHSVKVWDAAAKKAKRSFLYKAEVTSLSYSAAGTYLIATTNERNGVWLYTASNGKPFTKIKDWGMTASWAKTSESEKNVMLYSAQEGLLAYFSLKTGKPLKTVSAEGGLQNPVLFAKNNFFAGTKDGAICVLHAESGAKVKTVLAKNPVFLEQSGQSLAGADAAAASPLSYIDGAAGLFSVYKINVAENGIKGPLIFKNITTDAQPKFSAAFFAPAASGDGQKVILGAEDGNVFEADLAENGLPAALALVSNQVYQKILAACSDGQNLYLLTESSIIKADYESKQTTAFPNSRGWTKIDWAHGNLILRSENRAAGVRAMNPNSGEERLLFDTQSRVKKIREAEIKGKKGFLEIENSKVNFYSFGSGSLEELYMGSGIQDAAQVDPNTLAVAKTASSNPPSPLVLVNIKTRETVPVKMEGDITVHLEESGGYLFGSRLTAAGGGYATSAFCMGTKALTVKELAESAKEEADAFVRAFFPLALTRVGSKDISVIDVKTLKKRTLKSGSSFAVDIFVCGGRLASITEDSSVTWHNVEQAIPLAEWYIDGKNQIVEF